MIEFFMPIIPPETTHQQKKVHVVDGKPYFYEPDDLKKARVKLMGHLSEHTPKNKIMRPVRMMVKWCFPIVGSHEDGEYKYTKPDLDNSNKLLQDCMTKLGFWKDDSYVVSLIIEKFWAATPGIYIRIEEIE
ncbi:RusA family crossover junction endodeoxyribonuclease [Enterococcus avium]|uniref:RusA family crossover junction endodeoxyribonuclease n=1 Tax=Enterococcus avium TaxID=33945 RepID=UPI00288CB55A|nr:RusA family crossover junction endodeoxyribonuclease [Enterococcus avium]MDT2437410.1 RusA family crossover junction endodeoxyribonuclease [Enterococcus avium]